MAFARRADPALAATKQTHPELRQICKVLFLSLNYGRTVQGLASALGKSALEASVLMGRHMRAYPELYVWLDGVAHRTASADWMASCLGWRRYVGAGSDDCSPRSARNWPCQTAGAEALWLMACRVTEAGYRVCGLVRDVARHRALEQEVEACREVSAMMADMTSIVTSGIR